MTNEWMTYKSLVSKCSILAAYSCKHRVKWVDCFLNIRTWTFRIRISAAAELVTDGFTVLFFTRPFFLVYYLFSYFKYNHLFVPYSASTVERWLFRRWCIYFNRSGLENHFSNCGFKRKGKKNHLKQKWNMIKWNM